MKNPNHLKKHGSLFSGIGGFCAAFNEQGYLGAFANDLEPNVASAYQHNHFVERFHRGSVTDLVANDLPTVDVLHAGFPCQPFSVAGERAGFEDPRGLLFFEIPRLLKEYGRRRPKILLLENAPNLLIGNGGSWIKKISHELNKAGYWFDVSNAVLLDVALHGGIPQSRERLFIVALDSDVFDGNFIHQADFPVVPRRKIIEFFDQDDEVDERYYLPQGNKYEKLILSHRISDPNQIYQLRKFYVRLAPKGMCPTLTANMGMGGHNVPFVIRNGRVRKLTEKECLRLQGFRENFEFPDELRAAPKYQMIGNAVSPIIARLLVSKINALLES